MATAQIARPIPHVVRRSRINSATRLCGVSIWRAIAVGVSVAVLAILMESSVLFTAATERGPQLTAETASRGLTIPDQAMLAAGPIPWCLPQPRDAAAMWIHR